MSALALSLLVSSSVLGQRLPGVNMSGGEFNAGKANARVFFDYVYPSQNELNYFASKGLKVVRVPFDLGRLQPLRNEALNESEVQLLKTVVANAKTAGLTVLLDPHNYGTMVDDGGISQPIATAPSVPASDFADFWSRLALEFSADSNVMFGLMNEPHLQSAAEWKTAAVAAITAIRATGATTLILVPGTSWTGAHSWVSSGNAAAWAGFHDEHFAFDVHQYLDADSSGTHADCQTGVGASALVAFTTWARQNHVRGFLGEIGWADNAGCATEANALLGYLEANDDVWLGYTYWAAGAWLGPYMYTLEPTGLGTSTVTDAAPMRIVSKYLLGAPVDAGAGDSPIGARDGGVVVRDAGSVVDAGTGRPDAGLVSADAPTGCGCTMTGQALAGLVALTLTLILRRKV